MLMVLFSWLAIGGAAVIFGKAIVDRAYRDDIQRMGKIDIYIITGIIFMNIYAQLFSLFYKVAGFACTILGVAGIVLVAGWAVGLIRRKENPLHLDFLKAHPYRVVALLLCVVVTMTWTVQEAGHYDTGLYHAQAIRWIEEYGVVPGLGNLHMRLAYNSAFMSLQALFSLQWFLGQSLHTLNGFFCLLCLGYAVMTVRTREDQGWKVSDLLKCAIVIYIVWTRYNISSSGTDIWALLLVLYVCAKWCEFAEDEEESAAPWSFICLTGIYALTVKLSSALIVLLTIYPLYLMIKKKNVRQILGNAAAATMILLPFLIRNVIISGYLIYPYAGIDLFDVDWKMNPSVLASDSLDIKMFGRGIRKVNEYDNSLLRWIPRWFGRQQTGNQILILVGTVCTVAVLYRLWIYIRRKQIREIIFTVTILISLVFWLMTAPLIRYGSVYFLIMISIAVGGTNEREWNIDTNRIINIVLLFVMVPLLGSYIGKMETLSDMESKLWVKQEDYPSWPATQYQVENVSIWVPNEGDLVGYFAFPATAQKRYLQDLGLRGSNFQDGFYSHEQRAR
ncbi:MAG: hypothetical protein K2O65_10305 [Lachnospiraceae bacterium]|nr:hypothetical protein [Lachnospiraceae bacterium]